MGGKLQGRKFAEPVSQEGRVVSVVYTELLCKLQEWQPKPEMGQSFKELYKRGSLGGRQAHDSIY